MGKSFRRDNEYSKKFAGFRKQPKSNGNKNKKNSNTDSFDFSDRRSDPSEQYSQ